MRSTRKRTRGQRDEYSSLTWNILTARLRNELRADDAKVALAAIKNREHPAAIKKFVDVSIKIKTAEDRSTA